eukprot:8712070-Prorocentrum_lima.AAC.1
MAGKAFKGEICRKGCKSMTALLAHKRHLHGVHHGLTSMLRGKHLPNMWVLIQSKSQVGPAL